MRWEAFLDAINKAQDLHSMIAVLLESYVKIQETGFVWDLHYRNNVYKDVEFVLFTPFFKVDGCRFRRRRLEPIFVNGSLFVVNQ